MACSLKVHYDCVLRAFYAKDVKHILSLDLEGRRRLKDGME